MPWINLFFIFNADNISSLQTQVKVSVHVKAVAAGLRHSMALTGTSVINLNRLIESRCRTNYISKISYLKMK